VIALNGTVCNASVRVGGDEMDEAVIRYHKSSIKFVCLGESPVELIKIQIVLLSHLKKN
jgi:rod shape-determining protein MreB